MNNIDKVIKGLEWHIKAMKAGLCRFSLVDCPYVEDCKGENDMQLLEDALALLKQQKSMLHSEYE